MSRVIKTPPLFDHQKAVVKILDEHPNENIKVVVKSSRQKGKTLLILLLLLREAINKPGSKSFLVEPTNNQCRKCFKDCVNMLRSAKGIITSANASFLEIEFFNGSIIYFKSGEQRENLRGYTCTGLLALDEVAFLGQYIEELCFPYCNVPKSNILLFSTPKFKSGVYWDWYSRALQHFPGVYLVDFNDYDTSMLLSPEQLEAYRLSLSPNVFRSEYLGEFIEEGGTVFKDFARLYNKTPELTGVYSVGIDWGSGTGNDYTAVSVFNNKKEQVDVFYFNDLNPQEQIETIEQNLKKYYPTQRRGQTLNILVEMNSIGRIYYNLLSERLGKYYGVSISGFNTTNESKRRIVENMQVEIQNSGISLLPDTEQALQLSSYEIESTQTGKITFNASTGNHDDIVIADSLALYNLKTNNYVIL